MIYYYSSLQQAESVLKSDYKADMDIDACLKLAVKVLGKAMDTSVPTAEKVEFATVTLSPEGKVLKKVLSTEEVTALLKTVEDEVATAGDA